MTMTPPTEQQLALLQDQELHDLAVLWRRQAAHGMRAAFGVAHALEAECRRRGRERMAQVEPSYVRATRRVGQRHWLSRLWPSMKASGIGNKKGLGMSAESLA